MLDLFLYITHFTLKWDQALKTHLLFKINSYLLFFLVEQAQIQASSNPSRPVHLLPSFHLQVCKFLIDFLCLIMSKSKKFKLNPSSSTKNFEVYLWNPLLATDYPRLSSLENVLERFTSFSNFANYNLSSYFEQCGLFKLFRKSCKIKTQE